MFKALGFLIILWGLSTMLSSSFNSFDGAMTATFQAVEAAAISAELQFEYIH